MNWLRNMPIKRKVTLVILFTCSAALLLACAFLAVYQIYTFRNSLVQHTTVLADVLERNTQAALTFQDETAAAQTLHALEAEPSIAAAGLYARDGKSFANYKVPNKTGLLPDQAPPDGTHFGGGYLTVVRPIILNGKRIGTILLCADLQAMYDRLNVFALVAALVWIFSILGGLAFSTLLQRAISQPIVALNEAVRVVTERVVAEQGGAGREDYTVRLPVEGRDETGLLTVAFNQLLASIEKRDKALVATNDSLRRSEAQLQTVVENLNEGVAVSDLNGQLLHFNRAALELHGFAATDDIRQHFSKLVDTIELADMEGAVWTVDQWPISRILRGENLRNMEVRFRRKDGALNRVYNYGGTLVRDAGGKPLMAVVTMTDITERKMGEIKVREQLARLALLNQITRATGERLDLNSIFQVVVRTVEDQLPVDFCCICLLDQATRVLTVMSVGHHERLTSQLAMNRHEQVPVGENGLNRCIKGQLVYEPDVSTVQHPFPQRLAKAGLRAFVAAPLLVESSVLGILIASRRQKGSFSSGECEFLRQLTEHVALAAHQAQLHTALQQAYDDLRQTQQAVMQQERLRALGQMASGIAHDINNAISPVALYTESLLENEPNLSQRARDYLQTIQHSIEDVSQTVARMREFYRQRETQLTLLPVKLNGLVKQVVDLSRARWSDMPQQRGCFIELTMELADNLPPIAGVESEIREALLNLVFNAVDAMPEGGALILRTKVLPRSGGDETGPDSVAVEVSDTGAGMDEDTRRRCLEPFFTTKGERGTGLGLAMVYGIAQRHGAEIEIESVPGKGTTMRLVFPLPVMPLQASTPPAAASVPQTRLRILIVDDDPLLIKSLRDTLGMDGHAVTAANGGQAGIDAFMKAKTSNEIFDVVITDLGMPYVDGRKVAGAIKAASASTPVILLTGWGQRLVAEGDIPPNVDKVLNKPPKLRDVREALVAVLPASRK